MEKKKSVAIFLALFGGILGLHKFYLRDIGSGIFFIVLTYMFIGIFSMPLTFFLGLIDAFKIMGMSQEKFDSKYNKNIKPRSRRRRSYREEKTRRSNKRSSYEVRRSPKRKRANPFKTSAYKKYKEFDLEDALVDYKQALEISPEDKEIHYYIASVYSLMEKKDKAYYHLQKSVELGLKQTNKILESDDFAFLRIQPDFEVFKDNGFRLSAANEAPEKNIPMDDLLLSQLNKLKEMRERGLLSEKEFLTEKEKIIRR